MIRVDERNFNIFTLIGKLADTMQIPTLFSVLALGAIICLLSEHEIEANQGNLGAFKFNVTEQLRRLKEPFYDSEGAGYVYYGHQLRKSNK